LSQEFQIINVGTPALPASTERGKSPKSMKKKQRKDISGRMERGRSQPLEKPSQMIHPHRQPRGPTKPKSYSNTAIKGLLQSLKGPGGAWLQKTEDAGRGGHLHKTRDGGTYVTEQKQSQVKAQWTKLKRASPRLVQVFNHAKGKGGNYWKSLEEGSFLPSQKGATAFLTSPHFTREAGAPLSADAWA